MSDAKSRPLPDASARMASFWRAAKRGVLVIQRCSTCGRHRFPATELCSRCLSCEVEWVEASGDAELFSFVVVHHALDPYFAGRAPYLVADVKLAEGPHMTTTLVDCPPSDARIGESLKVRFERASDDFFLPVFRRA
jgi:uncharacterized OB-fold protein